MRPLTILPRSWRMTPAEDTVLDVISGVASRRVKVEANMLKFIDKDADAQHRLDVLSETIRVLDSVRADRDKVRNVTGKPLARLRRRS